MNDSAWIASRINRLELIKVDEHYEETFCCRPKMRNLVFEEVERLPVGYVSYSVSKVSDVLREIQSWGKNKIS